MQTEFTQYRRDAKRYASNFRAVLLVGDRRIGCTILDLSRLGAKLDLSRPIAPKTDIALIVDGIGFLDGFVVWYREPVAGIAFRPRAPHVAARLSEVLQRLKAAELRRPLDLTRAQFGRRMRA
jgi:hypothetical protein